MKLRVPLFVFTTLLATGVAFSQPPPQPQTNNTKLYQPDNNPVNTSSPGLTIGNPGPGSSFQVHYTNSTQNNNTVVNVMNTGSAGGVDPGGDICVNVYVYDTTQDFQGCCYCRVTPNGLAGITISGQFAPASLVIKLVATYPSDLRGPSSAGPFLCDPSTPATGIDPTTNPPSPQGTAYNSYAGNQQYLAPGQAAWLDISPAFGGPTVSHIVTEFHQSSMSKGEAARLAAQCGAAHNGVGNGGVPICPATGDCLQAGPN